MKDFSTDISCFIRILYLMSLDMCKFDSSCDDIPRDELFQFLKPFEENVFDFPSKSPNRRHTKQKMASAEGE